MAKRAHASGKKTGSVGFVYMGLSYPVVQGFRDQFAGFKNVFQIQGLTTTAMQSVSLLEHEGVVARALEKKEQVKKLAQSVKNILPGREKHLDVG